MEHVETPWTTSIAGNGFQSLIYGENDQTGETIAVVYTDQVDAEFIVKAVNSHDELVEALQKASEVLNTIANKLGDITQSTDMDTLNVRMLIQQALSNAL